MPDLRIIPMLSSVCTVFPFRWAARFLRLIRKCGEYLRLSTPSIEFILCLEITTPISNETAIASAKLQTKNLDLSASYTIVEGVIQRVKAMRPDEEFKVLFTKAIPEEIPGQARH